jgi:hypothetical protein
MRGVVTAFLAVGLLIACGGNSESDNPSSGGSGGSVGGKGGTGAKGGTGGAAATGGTSATGGGGAVGGGGAGGSLGGSAGVATGGSAGVATGGSAGIASGGSAGQATALPECTKDSECTLHSDCCSCQALAPGEPPPPACAQVCVQDKCSEQQLPAGAVACIAGRCVAGFDCDANKVTCKVQAPVCPAGQIPAVKGTCYAGGCVPTTECTSVTSCADCITATTACAGYQTKAGNQAHCVTIPAACGGNASCACMGPTVCVGPFTICTDFSGLKGVSCGCPTC